MPNIAETVITAPLTPVTIGYVAPSSVAKTQSYEFALDNVGDNICFFLDALAAQSCSFTATFSAGNTISGKSFTMTVNSGSIKVAKLSSAELFQTGGHGTLTLTTTREDGLNGSGAKFMFLKERLVTNN